MGLIFGGHWLGAAVGAYLGGAFYSLWARYERALDRRGAGGRAGRLPVPLRARGPEERAGAAAGVTDRPKSSFLAGDGVAHVLMAQGRPDFRAQLRDRAMGGGRGRRRIRLGFTRWTVGALVLLPFCPGT